MRRNCYSHQPVPWWTCELYVCCLAALAIISSHSEYSCLVSSIRSKCLLFFFFSKCEFPYCDAATASAARSYAPFTYGRSSIQVMWYVYSAMFCLLSIRLNVVLMMQGGLRVLHFACLRIFVRRRGRFNQKQKRNIERSWPKKISSLCEFHCKKSVKSIRLSNEEDLLWYYSFFPKQSTTISSSFLSSSYFSDFCCCASSWAHFFRK